MKVIMGICAICGQHKKLSFEHVPPRSAFNDKPIFMQTTEHLWEENSRFFGKKIKSNKGFGSFTLCEQCNNDTGDWYAKDFGEFAHQGMHIIKEMRDVPYVKGTYTIKPLNVFKQIITMFLSADKIGYLRSQKGLSEFILDKSSTDFPNDLKIFIYSNVSSTKRMIGYTIVWDQRLGVQKWAEVNFQPFGYLLAEDSSPAHENMVDVTEWHKIQYNKICKIEMTTAYLKVSSAVIGTYG